MGQKKFTIKTLIILCFISLLTGGIIASNLNWTNTSVAFENNTQNFQEALITRNSFVKIARELNPTVVYISSTQVVKGFQFHTPLKDPFRDFFGDDFFNKFFGIPKGELKQKSLGSGFIISEDGYIFTNYHVVKDAEDIKITLSNKNEYEAKIIGFDQDMDIALLKINVKESLPTVKMGDSDTLQIGEWVIAIGNPFGLEHTVTAGIVSAKWRSIGQGPYNSFIQTDASINPGNSGGPLIDLDGEIVGINTAITAEGQGIGFAIPINMAKGAFIELKEKGRITRGWLGLMIQKVTPELAKSFGLKENKGALVAEVVKDSPAEKAGIRQGDVIVSFNEKEINEYIDLSRLAGLTRPGTKVKLGVVRDTKKKEVTVKIEAFPDEEKISKAPIETELGMSVQDITPDLAEHLDLSEAKGILVTNIISEGPADKANIQRGDIIIEVDKQKITNVKTFKKVIKKGKKTLLFLINRGEHVLYTAVKKK